MSAPAAGSAPAPQDSGGASAAAEALAAASARLDRLRRKQVAAAAGSGNGSGAEATVSVAVQCGEVADGARTRFEWAWLVRYPCVQEALAAEVAAAEAEVLRWTVRLEPGVDPSSGRWKIKIRAQ
jgi:hypothetical protein